MLATAVTLALAAPLPALAAGVDYFLEIDGIKGESLETAVLSWSWGLSETAQGETCVQDLHLAKELDGMSSTLINAVDTGREFPQARLIMVEDSGSGPETRFEIDMGKVRVSSFQTGGSEGGGVPVEQLSLNFSRVEGFYLPPGDPEKNFMVLPGKCK